MDKLIAQARRYVKQAIAVILVVLAALTAVDQALQDPPAPPATPAPTVKLGGPGHTTIPRPTMLEQRAAAAALADHAGSRWDVTLDPAEAEKRQDGLEKLAAHDQLPLTAPDAAPTVPGCNSRFVRNYSSRGGVAPRELVAHYTVSRPGSGLAIVAMFDDPRFAASSNFVIDTDGTCWYIVRDTDKAWTQASANPYSVSIEFVAMGTETGLTPAQLAKGGSVWAYEAKKWSIPIRLGKVTNCLPATPGEVDHAMLGACGGGHHDLRPLNGTHVPPRVSEDQSALEPLLEATRAAAAPATSLGSLTHTEHAAAAALQHERAIAKRNHGWRNIAPLHLRRATAAKATLRRALARITAAAAKTGWDRGGRRARKATIEVHQSP